LAVAAAFHVVDRKYRQRGLGRRIVEELRPIATDAPTYDVVLRV
jgi:hypothetical protein